MPIFERLENRRLLAVDWSGGVIHDDTTWYASEGTYNLTGDVRIESGGSLTIESGVEVQGSSLYVFSGGMLSASNVTFQNSRVQLDRGSAASLSNNQFLGDNAFADVRLASNLSDNSFPPNSTVHILSNGSGGQLTTPASLPLITNVTYDLFGLYIESGGHLTIVDGNTITGSNLYIFSGGMLSASNVTFQNSRVQLDRGSAASLSNNQFLGDNAFADVRLASNLSDNSFPPNSTVHILSNGSGGQLTTPASLPLITNVTYDLFGLYIESGGHLTIVDGNTITGSNLYIFSGGAISAIGVTFNNQLRLQAGSTGIIKYSTFIDSSYSYFDGQMGVIVTGNDFSSSKVRAQGSGGTIKMEGNYWGVIDAGKIYDYYDSPGLPVIDYEPRLTAFVEPPEDALYRQIYQLPATAYDGTGYDINLWLGDVLPEQQVTVHVGHSLQDLHAIGVPFSNTNGGSTWQLQVDMAGSGTPVAQYVAVSSDQPVIILYADSVHQDSSALAGYQQYSPGVGVEPDVQPVDHHNAAQLYRWDYDASTFTELPQPEWLNQSLIDWNKKTIILTHGWDDSLHYSTNGITDDGGQHFIWKFAENFMDGRLPAELETFNLLAVDWYDDGTSRGSNPDNSNVLNPFDAQKSANNGIAAAKAIAERLNDVLGVNLHPDNMMLIGHSNGAGFMASMALTFLQLRGEKIAELTALDAPTLTSAWGEVVSAAAAGIRTSNYYMPLAQPGLPCACQFFGFGQRMAVPGPNVELTNFRLDATASLTDLGLAGIFEIGHFVVPDRYVATAYKDSTSENVFPDGYWGFQESAYVQGGPIPSDSHIFWTETNYAGFFDAPAISQLSVLELLDATRPILDFSIKTSTSIIEAVSGSVVQAWKGVQNAADLFVSGAASLFTFVAQSPVYGSLDVDIPEDADLLEFNLSVANPGNNDHLLVMIGDEVLRDIDLASVQLVGGVKEQIWIKDYAGTPETITFYMPSGEPSDAEFSISEVEFVDVNFPPTQIIGRHIFYNDSFFDDPTFGNDDDTAIDPTKEALLPGQTATNANYISYTQGINGIMVDIANPEGTIDADDFEFHDMGRDGNSETIAPPPDSITVRPGEGVGGSDRIVMTWDTSGGAVFDTTWLRVTVGTSLGLPADDVFYFGSAPGEGSGGEFAQIDPADELGARNNTHGFGNPAAVDDPWDYNKDRFVDPADQLFARNNGTGFADRLELFSAPLPVPLFAGLLEGDDSSNRVRATPTVAALVGDESGWSRLGAVASGSKAFAGNRSTSTADERIWADDDEELLLTGALVNGKDADVDGAYGENADWLAWDGL
ncbi:MAG: hypothetical protein WDZ59_12170 [Pirellulales bacterium]